MNDGGAPTTGETVTVTDTLPPGLVVVGVGSSIAPQAPQAAECQHAGLVVSCTLQAAVPGESRSGLSIVIEVAVESGVTGVLGQPNMVTVAGGGAATVSTTNAVTVTGAQPVFGLNGPLSASVFDETGAVDTQAGDHPASSTTGFDLNTVPRQDLEQSKLEQTLTEPVQDLRDVIVDLPVGLVADPQAAATCPQYLVAPPNNGHQCPEASVVGTVALAKGGTGFWKVSGPITDNGILPIFNVPPERGRAAQFAFIFANQEITLYANIVHSAAGYVVQVSSFGIPPSVRINGVKATFFGDPALADDGGTTPTAFFTNPQDCAGGALTTYMYMDSWQDPGLTLADGSPDTSDPAWKAAESVAPAPTGCGKLQFHPEIEVAPTTQQSGSPTGLTVDLKIPQNANPSGLATPDLKDATVALPRGLSISPSSAGGLEACSDAEIGLGSTEAASCPEGSVIGTVTVHTPLLSELLQGRVFLGTPECDPCSDADAQSGRLVRLFIEITNSARGIDVKLPGTVSVDPATGQLVAKFAESPQLPFDHLEFDFKSGERAPLSTPESCGSFVSSVDLSPWSAPYTADALLEPGFQITEGCGARGFVPTFEAGTVSNAAGGFSPFTATFSRSAGDQGLSGLQVQTPPGVLALLSSVPLCGEAQANAGTCPAASEIGHTTVVAGPGSEPLTVPEAGQPPALVYLTGGYKGAPFGLSVVVPAVAGPFNLGSVVVRAAISVNPHTGQATITSDPLPQILDGIPLQIRTVNVTIDRGGFMFNPTSCDPSSVDANLQSTKGASFSTSDRFQAAGCGGLPFKPVLSASVAAHASKASGASLEVKVSSKGGPQPGGGEANIAAVKVDLPKQLPSRLTTLQKACLAAVFEANPAACPKESDVGTATAVTPVLAQPLSGPAYLVSHGSAKFPDLEIVLQGEGVVLILDGLTNIKKGITSSDFNTVPDAPIKSFELKLPTGKFSALGAYLPEKTKYNLCGQSLSMPTMMTAQNGAVIKQTTKIAVTGCPKAAKAKTAKKKAKKAQRR